MKNVFIYALNCPISGRTRYIGKSADPARRLSWHLHRPGKTHKDRWVSSLLAAKLSPVLEIIDEVLEEEWPMLEAAYIQFFREEGFNLTNSTDGGEGITMTPETCAKISLALRGKKHSPERCATHLGNKYGRGYRHSDEARAKISAAGMGNRFALGCHPSAETRAKISVALCGKKRSSETRAKMSAARLGENNPCFGKKHSSEHCAKIGAASRAAWAIRKAKQSALS